MTDHELLDRAIALALASEARGGLPVGAVIGLAGTILAEGTSDVIGPPYHPGRHAETTALAPLARDLLDPTWQLQRKELQCSPLRPS